MKKIFKITAKIFFLAIAIIVFALILIKLFWVLFTLIEGNFPNYPQVKYDQLKFDKVIFTFPKDLDTSQKSNKISIPIGLKNNLTGYIEGDYEKEDHRGGQIDLKKLQFVFPDKRKSIIYIARPRIDFGGIWKVSFSSQTEEIRTFSHHGITATHLIVSEFQIRSNTLTEYKLPHSYCLSDSTQNP